MNNSASTEGGNTGIRNTLLGIVGFIAMVLGLFTASLLMPKQLSREDFLTLGYYPLAKTRAVSEFKLQNHKGENFVPDSMKGRWSMLFFGYTSCPDVCPVTLAQLNKMVQQLEPEVSSQLQILLVSVDPERDTLPILNQYIGGFNKDFSAVTGEFDELVKLATQLNVAFGKVPGYEPGTYLVDHSASIVVVDPSGRYHGFLKAPHRPDKMASIARGLVSS